MTTKAIPRSESVNIFPDITSFYHPVYTESSANCTALAFISGRPRDRLGSARYFRLTNLFNISPSSRRNYGVWIHNRSHYSSGTKIPVCKQSVCQNSSKFLKQCNPYPFSDYCVPCLLSRLEYTSCSRQRFMNILLFWQRKICMWLVFGKSKIISRATIQWLCIWLKGCRKWNWFLPVSCNTAVSTIFFCLLGNERRQKTLFTLAEKLKGRLRNRNLFGVFRFAFLCLHPYSYNSYQELICCWRVESEWKRDFFFLRWTWGRKFILMMIESHRRELWSNFRHLFQLKIHRLCNVTIQTVVCFPYISLFSHSLAAFWICIRDDYYHDQTVFCLTKRHLVTL